MQPKVKVFVSHSFDSDDKHDVAKILAFLRLSKFHLEVLTARSPEARKIGDKIEGLVAWADVTFGIFTKRYRDGESEVWVPPPYVLTECAYAKGQYAGNAYKGVHGLVEAGVKHTDLGLLTISGDEFPPFQRQQFSRGETATFEAFLMTLQKRYGPAALIPPKRPYKQREVRKTVEILRNGTAVFKHTVTIGVYQPDPVSKRGILHELWAPQGAPNLPPLEEMARVPLVKHHDQASFSCSCIRKNAETINMPMRVERHQQDARSIRFRLRFPFELRSSDVLCYQYVWSLPKAFATCEEDLGARGYNEIPLRTPHGPITDAILKVKFEREIVHGASAELFSKKPFLLYSYTQNEDAFALEEPTPVPLVEYDAMWEIYQAHIPHLQNAVLLRWQPSSRATIREALRSAEAEAAIGGDSGRPTSALRARKKMARIHAPARRSRRPA